MTSVETGTKGEVMHGRRLKNHKKMRRPRIERGTTAWKAVILPLNYWRYCAVTTRQENHYTIPRQLLPVSEARPACSDHHIFKQVLYRYGKCCNTCAVRQHAIKRCLKNDANNSK